jgi:predicted nucleotidyltransferase
MDSDFVAFSKGDDDADDNDVVEDIAPALLTSTPAPWLAYAYQYDRKAPPLVRLHNEVLTFCEYIAPSVHEMNVRETVLAEISEVILSLWPGATISVFGSQMTKILTPASDLDLVVMNVPENKRDTSELYITLAQKLRDSSLCSYCESITHAKVPIVKLDHGKSGISVDIAINNDSGFRTGQLIRQFVKDFPPLRPMVLVLKMFLVRKLGPCYTVALMMNKKCLYSFRHKGSLMKLIQEGLDLFCSR